jgi:hypothetical protein
LYLGDNADHLGFVSLCIIGRILLVLHFLFRDKSVSVVCFRVFLFVRADRVLLSVVLAGLVLIRAFVRLFFVLIVFVVASFLFCILKLRIRELFVPVHFLSVDGAASAPASSVATAAVAVSYPACTASAPATYALNRPSAIVIFVTSAAASKSGIS